MKIYLLPKGAKFSGQTSSFNKNRSFDHVIIFPIWDKELSLICNVKMLILARKNINKLKRNDELTISLALGKSYLIRVIFITLFCKCKKSFEIHSGLNVKIDLLSKSILSLLFNNTREIKILGPNKFLEQTAKKKKIKINYFRNEVSFKNQIMSSGARKYKYGFLALNIESKGYLEFLNIISTINEEQSSIVGGPYAKSKYCSEKHTHKNFTKNINSFVIKGGTYKDSVVDKMSFYSSIDTFVITSTFPGEALPMVFLEALFFGCKIITTDIGYLNHYFFDKKGISINKDANEILKVINDLSELKIDSKVLRSYYYEYITN